MEILECQKLETSVNLSSKAGKTMRQELTAEELKIREELATEIDNLMEEEIKDSIYSLALRLQHLYAEHKWKNKTSPSRINFRFRVAANDLISTDVKITIVKKEGIKITSKRIGTGSDARTQRTSRLKAEPAKNGSSGSPFHWPKSLRMRVKNIRLVAAGPEEMSL